MISQNALHHAEKCRFCWMCRHLCPIQHQTGKELNTPRAKGLLLSMVNKGAQVFDKDMAEAMYECVLCDACTNDCATGYQPPLFIREARTEAVVNELAPAAVMELIDKALESGNVYGVQKPSFGQEGTDVLVYIGDVAAIKVPEMAKNLLAVLAKAGVSAKVLAEEPTSGMMLADLMGYTQEVVDQAKACAEAINGAKLPVIVLDSYDAEIMKQHYAEWGCEIKAEVVTATAYVAKLLEDYRTQLLVFRYENMFVNERLDTVVSQKEREEYYNLHLKSYVTKNGIIKGRVINMHNSSPKIKELERLLSKEDVNSIVEVEQLGYSSSYKYNNFNDEWVDLAVVAKEMGIVLSDLQKELAKKKTPYFKYKDSLNTSYLQTFEYVMAGEITPLEYNSESIKDIIISKRKKDLLQKLQSDIYKEALENKKIKIIENEKAD